MIKFKLFIEFFCLALALGFFSPTASAASVSGLSPTPVLYKTDSVNSYELFWPVSAGRVMGDKLYFLKILKENIRGALIFNDLKKAEYNITLSEKRTVEAEKLFTVTKDYNSGKKTLDAAKQKQEKASAFLKKADGKDRYIGDVKNRMLYSFKNQRDVLNDISLKVAQDQKVILEGSSNQLNLLLKSIE